MMLPLAFFLIAGSITCQAQTLTPVRELEVNAGPITKISFDSQDDHVAVTRSDPRLGWLSTISRVNKFGSRLDLGGEGLPIPAVTFSPDGATCAWAVGPRLLITSLSAKSGTSGPVIKFPASAAAFSPDGTLLAASANSIKAGHVLVHLFDAKTGGLRTELKAPVKVDPLESLKDIPAQLRFSPDGKSLFAIAQRNIFQWDLATKRVFPTTFSLGFDTTLSPDTHFSASISPQFLTSMPDGTDVSPMQLSLSDGKRSIALTVEGGDGENLEWSGPPAFSLDSRFLAAPVWRNGQNFIVIWRISDHKEILRRPTQFEQKLVVFGPEDGQGIALASVYENSINKLQHAILWRLTLPQ